MLWHRHKTHHSKSERWESERVLAFHIVNIVILCYTCIYIRPCCSIYYTRKGSVKDDFSFRKRCQHPISTHINCIFCLSWNPLQYSYASPFALRSLPMLVVDVVHSVSYVQYMSICFLAWTVIVKLYVEITGALHLCRAIRNVANIEYPTDRNRNS